MAMPKTLNLDDIALLWNCSRRRARDVVVKAPDFPPRARGSSWRYPVWLEEDVANYLCGQPKTEGEKQ